MAYLRTFSLFSLIRNLGKTPQALSVNQRCSISIERKAEKIFVENIKASELTKDNIPPKATRGCPICSRGITFTYKDVPFLSQFMNSDGMMLNRRITGVCKKQQKILHKKINIARRLGILPNFNVIKKEIKD